MFMAKYANTREKEQNYEDHSTTRHSTKNVIEKVKGLMGFVMHDHEIESLGLSCQSRKVEKKLKFRNELSYAGRLPRFL